jgi:small subunit ribosomal protein S12
MSTQNQLKLSRLRVRKKCRMKALRRCPQKQGVCMKFILMAPKKPNSAKRKVVKITLSTRKDIFGYIPGEGHNLTKFAHVLVRGGRIRDLPGVQYTLIRGIKDLQGLPKRRHGRSKYGTRLTWRVKKADRKNAKQRLKTAWQALRLKKEND